MVPLFAMKDLARSNNALDGALRSLRTDGALCIEIPQEVGMGLLDAAHLIHGISPDQRGELTWQPRFGCHGLVETRSDDSGVATARSYASFDVGSWSELDPDSDPLRAVLNSPTPRSSDLKVNQVVESAYRSLKALADEIVPLVERALGLSGSIAQHRSQPCDQMRLIAYETSSSGLGPHTDYELFTLTVSSGPGLEVLNAEGQWVAVQGGPAVAALMVGDTLEMLTRGSVESTLHRVVPTAFSRHSVVFFCGLDYDAFIPSDSEDSPLQAFGTRLAGFMARNHVHLRTQFDGDEELRRLMAPAENPMKAAKLRKVNPTIQ